MTLRRKAAVVVVASSMILPAAYALSAEGAPQAQESAAKPMPAAEKAPHKAAKHHEAKGTAHTKAIQEALNKHRANLKVDGMFGKETRAALEKFQKENGLKPTGKADEATLEKLGVARPASAKAAPAKAAPKKEAPAKEAPAKE